MVNASALCGGSHDLGLLSADCSARTNACSSCSEFSAPQVLLGCKERESRGGIDVVAEISAELQRERKKNVELMDRILLLEAEIQAREKASLPAAEQDGCPGATYRSFKKFKRQKIETRNDEVKDAEAEKYIDGATKMEHQIPCVETSSQPDHIVNWMSMDETQFPNFDKLKDGDSVIDCGDTDDSDDDDDYYDEDDTDIEDKNRYEDDDSHVANASKTNLVGHEEVVDDGPHIQTESRTLSVKQEVPGDQNKGLLSPDTKLSHDASNTSNVRELKRNDRKESKKPRKQKASIETHCSSQDIGNKPLGTLLSSYRKPPKVAFCPKEVRRMMESEALQLKNAQSHTIRKIIVFASLGIRHGCEDMYELDFNHFRILRKGEPYVSPKDPGEHVLYEHPSVRRKIFYPNQQNPIMCPVQILEEEKAMRPSDPSCPSCLFLCIKYGGRTRNLPQNEYVRQRMGRNKLKSFGPLMCDMALLIHIRCGSFFFKALGITLLFMAGFPDDLVQRETKYRNLDLLQKYYRTDEDAEGEDLFRPLPTLYDTASPNSQPLSCKPALAAPKSHGKRQTPPVSKTQNSQKPAIPPSLSSASIPPTQFGLMGYNSIHTQAMSAFHSMQSHTLTNASPMSNTSNSGPNPSSTSHMGPAPPPYPMFPPYPMNTFMPLSFWHNTNAYPPCPFPTSYGYRPFPPMNYISQQSHPYYPTLPKVVENTRKKDTASEEADSDSDSSSSSTEQKTPLASYM
ncbi:uncharacterized protein LOC131240178 isoform X2 [Magnolia sinica]|nr:uncharacterized protein LOC131240178 isoform X2 [Magnolia sinica]